MNDVESYAQGSITWRDTVMSGDLTFPDKHTECAKKLIFIYASLFRQAASK